MILPPVAPQFYSRSYIRHHFVTFQRHSGSRTPATPFSHYMTGGYTYVSSPSLLSIFLLSSSLDRPPPSLRGVSLSSDLTRRHYWLVPHQNPINLLSPCWRGILHLGCYDILCVITSEPLDLPPIGCVALCPLALPQYMELRSGCIHPRALRAAAGALQYRPRPRVWPAD